MTRRPDFAEQIRKACDDHHLDVFVSTHPDKDHTGGFCELFHCGSPDTWDGDPEDGEPKIIVDEIWCSPYGANPHYTTDHSKALVDEIRRRERLIGTAAAGPCRKPAPDQWTRPVTRPARLPTGSNGGCWRRRRRSGTSLSRRRVAQRPSSNPTSLVIQWSIKRSWGVNQFLLCGDTSVEVLERLQRQVHANNPDHLAWHGPSCTTPLFAPLDRRVLNGGCTDEEFLVSEEAMTALGEQRGDGYVVASSRRVVRGGNTPPSLARQATVPQDSRQGRHRRRCGTRAVSLHRRQRG